MSTKNLARTVIEGGRCGRYKVEVADFKGSERAANQNYMRLVETDPEAWDDLVVPERKVAYACFADKLNPAQKFLDSNVGRPWSKVKSELHQKFDARTTPGRHVLFDHLFRDVAVGLQPDTPYRRFFRWFVDGHGILRKTKENKTPKNKPKSKSKQLPWTKEGVAKWLGNRKVRRCGEKFVWLVPTNGGACLKAVWGTRSYPNNMSLHPMTVYDFAYVATDARGKIVLEPIGPLYDRQGNPRQRYPWEHTHREVHARPAYRQAKLLSKDEEEYFRALPVSAQRVVLGEATNQWL